VFHVLFFSVSDKHHIIIIILQLSLITTIITIIIIILGIFSNKVVTATQYFITLNAKKSRKNF